MHETYFVTHYTILNCLHDYVIYPYLDGLLAHFDYSNLDLGMLRLLVYVLRIL